MSAPGSITAATRADTGPSYMPSVNTGTVGGGTYTSDSVQPTLEAYENIFGPSARDIKVDLQRFKRHGRWHLPDVLKGPNQYLTDRIDGLITDHTNSPFTSRILPYKYITNVDGKIKWNVWNFDEGLASRVPYESAARTLQQSKRSYAGFAVRQGMAIVLEHNFMMSEAGRVNFKNQLNQLCGSIQMTNDLDVHTALVLAPSYERTMREKYMGNDKSPSQICREYVDLFGFMQKNVNALDILIEEAKTQLRMWGSPMPDFLLCNSKITFNLQMTPDRTNFVTQGEEGQKRLRAGPNIDSYRGIGIIPTRSFSMETGAPPRDMLRRRVRVAEYYRIAPHEDNAQRMFGLYNEERDTWFQMSFKELLQKAKMTLNSGLDPTLPGSSNFDRINACIQDIERSARAPGMRAAMDPSDIQPVNTLKQVESFLHKLMDGSLKQQLVETADLVHDDIVYVPGAVDPTMTTAYARQWNELDVTAQPLYIQRACKDIARPIKNGQAQVESLANYPRRIHGFWTKAITDGTQYDSGADFQTQYNAISTVAGTFKQARRNDAQARMLRNWNRYAVPSRAVLNMNTFKDLCRRRANDKLSDALNNGIFPDKDAVIAEYLSPNSLLRTNMGAFFCPNFFHNSVLNRNTFAQLGNELGRNILLTEQLINAFTTRTLDAVKDQLPEVHAQYQDSLLYNAIMSGPHASALVDNIKREIDAKLVQLRAATTRVDYTDILHAALVNACTGIATYNKKSHNEESLHFWTWPVDVDNIFTPGADQMKLDYMIHHTARGVPVAGGALDNMSQFDETRLTHLKNHWVGSVDANQFLRKSDSLKTQLAACTEFTRENAVEFLCMIAWRLWGDQLVPLNTIGTGYDRGGEWNSIDNYLSPKLYRHDWFGGDRTDPSQFRSFARPSATALPANMEVVIVRPNIEHFMFGIILGQGGEGLGSTFWGQTELSCYDDSQHGIWGMSYKYHERAMVINERNLIRLWDIGYDGYVGGKDDKCVNWDSMEQFKRDTVDVTKPYRGDSMMVMAFDHSDKEMPRFAPLYDQGFKSNWPSPIVFEDYGGADDDNFTVDYENINIINRKEFRVFNQGIYENAYKRYLEKMPSFNQLHKLRKNAGQASMEGETSSDSLAFQGTLQVYNAQGIKISETLGSGHHGPDFVGVASLRAGKGYKISGQPTVQRLV